jgi:hypothetical protein
MSLYRVLIIFFTALELLLRRFIALELPFYPVSTHITPLTALELLLYPVSTPVTLLYRALTPALPRFNSLYVLLLRFNHFFTALELPLRCFIAL